MMPFGRDLRIPARLDLAAPKPPPTFPNAIVFGNAGTSITEHRRGQGPAKHRPGLFSGKSLGMACFSGL
jgi:hypothetical protein